MSTPFKIIDPFSNGCNPKMHLIVVLLPAPFLPTTATVSPLSILRLRFVSDAFSAAKEIIETDPDLTDPNHVLLAAQLSEYILSDFSTI